MERWIMSAGLTEQATPATQPGTELVAWAERWQPAATELLNAAYKGTPEAVLYPVLVSPGGCRQMLRQLQREGTLLAAATGLLLEQERPLGVVIATRVSDERASIEHLGVLPGSRGRGLGRTLLGWSLARMQQAGFRRAELHVTADNGPALALYRAAGFTLAGSYEARPPA